MQEFLLQIKALSDALASVGGPIMLQEHIDSIPEGLSLDYLSIIAIIESKFEPLLAHEARLNKFTKQTLSNSPSINYPQAHHKSSVISSDDYSVPNKTDPESFSAFRGGGSFHRGGDGAGHRGGGGGCGSGGSCFASFQCQVCLKFDHTTSVCHYRFDQYYQPNSTLVLHDPLSPNYSQATSTPSQNNYNNYSQNSNNAGQTSGDSRPANVWTNNNYKSASINSQSNPSVMLTNAQPQSNSTN